MHREIKTPIAMGILFLTVFVAGGFIWQANMESIRNNPNSQVNRSASKQPAGVFSREEANSNKFYSKLVNLSFINPDGANYQEKDIFSGMETEHTGLNVIFEDKNNVFPSFETGTYDFSAISTVPQDIIDGTLDSENSFRISYFIDKYTKIDEKDPGMYLVAGYHNIECAASISTFLIVAPPKESNLEYISFFLGTHNRFSERDKFNECDIKETTIKRNINEIMNGKVDQINGNLASSVAVAKTFNTNK